MNQMYLYGVIAVLLIIPVKFLIPKMMDSDDPKLRFGIGVILFLVYTVVLLLVCGYMNVIAPAAARTDYFLRCAVGIILTNLAVLIAACQCFYIKDRRKMTESKKMKLKDL